MTKNRLALIFVGALVIPCCRAAIASPAPDSDASVRQPTGPIELAVDASDVAKKVFHVRETMPVEAGPLTLWYPKWIPGEHAPDGPIANLAGLVFMADGKSVAWQRDPVNMYAFHLDIPRGAHTLRISFDFLAVSGGSTPDQAATPNLMDLEWNEVALYPKVQSTDQLGYSPSVRLPHDWQLGSALRVASRSGDLVQFKAVPFNTLVDSPVIAGKYFKQVDLSPDTPLDEHLDIVADYPAALAMTGEQIKGFRKLVVQEKALFGSHHYDHYDALFTLSDHVVNSGLEHHQSSNDREPAESLIDPDHALLAATMLPHEFTHSWNGKFRRPEGLWQPNFEEPEHTRMLWVYEGLTEYLGDFVLPVRDGMWTKETARDALALTAADMDHRPGRTWRPLIDTTTAAPILYDAPGEWSNWRRGTDFYPEGALIWLAVDTEIRTLSDGQKSLDDFCKQFYGVDNGRVKTLTYTFQDVVAALNRVQPHDWAQYLRTRLDRTQYHAPLDGLTGGGWKLVYTDTPSHYQEAFESVHQASDRMFGIGFDISHQGTIGDVLWNGPADKGGVAPGVKLIAVNGRKFTPTVLDHAIAAAEKDKAPIQLLVNNQGTYATYNVDYHAGLKYPHLVRVRGRPDYLSQIFTPLPASH